MEKEVFAMAIKLITKAFFIMFAINIMVCGTFAYYIHKSYNTGSIEAVIENTESDNNQNSIKAR